VSLFRKDLVLGLEFVNNMLNMSYIMSIAR